MPAYEVGDVHRIIADKLEEAIHGRDKRIIIDCPPRHGKSELSSKRAPAFFLGKYPHKDIIAASYGAELATSFGRDVRNIVDSAEYKVLFPNTELATDSQAKNKWHTNKGGQYLAAGVGGPIVGMGAHLLIIDDVVKSRAEAESEAYRNGVWDWYRGSAYPRLMPGGSIILIMTRWHEEDLAGRLIAEENEGGEKWEKVILPAIDPITGAALWPEAYPLDRLKIIRKTIGEREWTSQYEQQPRPIEGSFFNINDMMEPREEMRPNGDGLLHPVKIYEPVAYPTDCDVVFAVIDSAAKTRSENDGTAVTYYARSRYHGYPLMILDWDIIQIEGALLETWLPQVLQTCEALAARCRARMGSLGAWIEDKVSGTILLQQAARRGLQANAIDSKLTSLGKQERAINISGYINRRMVRITKEAYEKVKMYKGITKNHFLSQVLGFHVGTQDMGDDDLLDTFTYGVAIALGNIEGF